MAKLPSVDDIRQPAPQTAGAIATVPRGLGPTGAEGRALAQAGDDLFKAGIRIRDRDDSVDRANKELKLVDDSVKALEAFRTGADSPDISNNQILEQYNQGVMTLNESLLAAHIETGASQASIARLRTTLAKSESTLIGKATFLSQKIALANLDTAFERKVSPLIEEVSKTPTIEVVDSALAEVAELVEDLIASTDPIEAQERLAEQQELIVETAFKTYIGRGHAESAEAILDQFSSSISNEKQAELRGKIATSRNTKSALRDKIAVLEEAGITVTNEMLKRMTGAVPSETDKDEFRTNLVGRGFSEDFAFDVSNALVRIVQDQFGDYFQVNDVTGKITPVSDADKKIIDKERKKQTGEPAEQEEEKQEFPKPRTKIQEAAEIGIGIFSGLRAGISNTIGQLRAGTEFEDTTSARQDLRTFNQMVKAAFILNKRFPLGEQKTITGFLPDPARLAKDPATAAADIERMEVFIIERQAAAQKEFDTGKITKKRKGQLADDISLRNEILSMIQKREVLEQDDQGRPIATTQEEYDSLPSGTELVWAPEGQTPKVGTKP